jgi:hypothetical protein
MEVYVINTALRSRNRHAADISIGGQKVRPGQRSYLSVETIAEEFEKLGQLEAGGLIELRNAQTGNLVSVSDFAPKAPPPKAIKEEKPVSKGVSPGVVEERIAPTVPAALATDRPPSVSELLGMSTVVEAKPISPPSAKVFDISGGEKKEERPAEESGELKPGKRRRRTEE